MKNPLRQPIKNPTPAMKSAWFVVQLAAIVGSISAVAVFVFQVAIYNGMLPTAPDALYTHPIQVMGHRAYLGDLLNLLFWGFFLTGSGSVFAAAAAMGTYRMLNEREKDRMHTIRMDWMKNRPLD